MDFDEVNVVYKDGQNMDAAIEYLKDIPISIMGGEGLELELSTVNNNCVSLDPKNEDVWYGGIENIDPKKYCSNIAISNAELGRRPMLFVHERSGEQRWVRMFFQPKKTAD